jgi:hypothetical protein
MPCPVASARGCNRLAAALPFKGVIPATAPSVQVVTSVQRGHPEDRQEIRRDPVHQRTRLLEAHDAGQKVSQGETPKKSLVLAKKSSEQGEPFFGDGV